MKKFGPGCPWYDMHEQWGPANVKWCEETLCAVINEPANAWSNLAFIIFGLYFWNKHRQNKKSGQSNVAWLAMSGVLAGLFSFVYHATNNVLTQYLDFLGMYILEFFMITLNMSRWKGAKINKTFYWLAVVVVTLITPLFMRTGFPIQLLVLFAALAIVGTEYLCMRNGKPAPHYKNFMMMTVGFGVALTFSILDVTRLMCDPQNHFLQGHALWHVFSAIGLIFAIKHYASVEESACGASGEGSACAASGEGKR